MSKTKINQWSKCIIQQSTTNYHKIFCEDFVKDLTFKYENY